MTNTPTVEERAEWRALDKKSDMHTLASHSIFNEGWGNSRVLLQ